MPSSPAKYTVSSISVNNLATVPVDVATVYEERSARSMRATFDGSVDPAEPTTSVPPMTARSRTLGSFSISRGATEVKVPVDRS